jgi:ADP-ribosylglycohydrolase
MKAQMRPRVYFHGLLIILISAQFLFFAGRLQAQTPFYQGKTLTIINGNEPGGTAGAVRPGAANAYLAAAVQYSAESSRTTHGAPECLDACRLLAGMICGALSGRSKEEILFGEAGSFHGEPKIMAIARGQYRDKAAGQIRGTGYVVESLEAALWCFYHTDTFEAAVLKAANLGDDADTTAAVCGQVAGAYYGESGFPKKWLDRLVMRQEIAELADCLRDR